MDCPITDLMDEDKCYGHLLELLHPGGLIPARRDAASATAWACIAATALRSWIFNAPIAAASSMPSPTPSSTTPIAARRN